MLNDIYVSCCSHWETGQMCVTPSWPPIFNIMYFVLCTYVLFLILGCASGKSLSSTLRNVPELLFTCKSIPVDSCVIIHFKRDKSDSCVVPSTVWASRGPSSYFKCMPVLSLSYQSDVFGICTQLSHSTRCKTGIVCSIADKYGYS